MEELHSATRFLMKLFVLPPPRSWLAGWAVHSSTSSVGAECRAVQYDVRRVSCFPNSQFWFPNLNQVPTEMPVRQVLTETVEIGRCFDIFEIALWY